jgi:hypothetical protein
MRDLEAQLVELGRRVETPPAPAFRHAVAARIGERRHVRWWPAVAVLAAAVGIAFAVPPARSAILRLFHLDGVTVERVETLPAVRERSLGSALGPSMPRDAAERVLGFRLLLPPKAHVRRVRVFDGLGSVLLERGGRTLLLSEFRAQGFDLLKKVAGPATRVEPVHVDGDLGLWLAGGRHQLMFVRRGRPLEAGPIDVAGNVLLWQRHPLTLRLQGALTKRVALAIATSLR